MSDAHPKPKDIWDKLDVLGKLVSGIILVVIAVVLKEGSDEISNSMKSGQLVQSLIADLATPQTQQTAIRQEVALAALNRALWDQNPDLVWDVTERIIWNSRNLSYARNYALQVLLERDSVRARLFLGELGRDGFDSDAAPDSAQRDTSPRVSDPVTESLLSRYLGQVIYVQFHGRANEPIAEALRLELISQGFTSPQIERVDEPVNRVYYFHPQDSAVAWNVAGIVRSFFDEQQISEGSSPLKVMSLVDRYEAPEGQVEVWISPTPSG